MDNLSAVDTSPQEAMNPEHLALDLWAMAARSGLRPLKIGMHTVLREPWLAWVGWVRCPRLICVATTPT